MNGKMQRNASNYEPSRHFRRYQRARNRVWWTNFVNSGRNGINFGSQTGANADRHRCNRRREFYCSLRLAWFFLRRKLRNGRWHAFDRGLRQSRRRASFNGRKIFGNDGFFHFRHPGQKRQTRSDHPWKQRGKNALQRIWAAQKTQKGRFKWSVKLQSAIVDRSSILKKKQLWGALNTSQSCFLSRVSHYLDSGPPSSTSG